ncbi:cyclic AMP response element-binding protein A-like isoform X2 [Tribolium madens]|uniref:cyclic AMP response element-binding protein A-like isoform X2 n=1 Tax=Tribolium madens TaxID=41895 RepID=UPI001CF740FD|nr:cyclic AMP response element-binding protein A-like isoform X2 [Tribolium madens]
MEVFPTLIGPNDDFKELWEADLDPTMQEVLRLNAAGDVEWSYMDKDLPGVIIHDRLMTDAALGTRPIKTEHSYSLASDGDSLPDSPISHNKLEEMDDECFSLPLKKDTITIKDEPLSETDSSSCPSSPQSSFMNTSELHFDVEMVTTPTTFHRTHLTTNLQKTSQSLLKPSSNIIISSPHNVIPQRIMPKLNIKIEPGHAFHLPPTPPSCSSSEDSEDNATISQPPSPNVRKTNTRVIMSHATRQPIHTPLISSQPKGSTGTLVLTDEEKRTLIAEGYPVPTRLPLTKAEEKSLKKIRRKIKNKISAQESRRKKKEYMDQLERKVELLVSENNEYRTKIESLEDSNTNLLNQLQKLQAIVARTHPQLIKQIK